MGSKERTTPYILKGPNYSIKWNPRHSDSVDIEAKGLTMKEVRYLGKFLLEWAGEPEKGGE